MRRRTPVPPVTLRKEFRRLIAEEKRLVMDIDRIIERNDSLSAVAKRGLIEIEKKLIRNITAVSG